MHRSPNTWNTFCIMEQENWKPVKGYEGLYIVSNIGAIKRLPYDVVTRKPNSNDTFIRHFSGGILRPHLCKSNNYPMVTLSKNGTNYYKYVHRIVAEAFIPNPFNLPCINHKDENRKNFQVDNLEWCTYSYNNTYNQNAKKRGNVLRNKYRKSVAMSDKTGNIIKVFSSLYDAADYVGVTYSTVKRAADKKRQTAKGYYFDYV